MLVLQVRKNGPPFATRLNYLTDFPNRTICTDFAWPFERRAYFKSKSKSAGVHQTSPGRRSTSMRLHPRLEPLDPQRVAAPVHVQAVRPEPLRLRLAILAQHRREHVDIGHAPLRRRVLAHQRVSRADLRQKLAARHAGLDRDEGDRHAGVE